VPVHHPDDSLLVEYAAGSLGEAKSLLVATHLALCPACRRAVRSGEAASAVLAFGDDVIEAVTTVAPPEVDAAAIEAHPGPASRTASSTLPEPLRSYLGVPVAELAWVPVGLGMRAFALPALAGATSVRLLAIPPGRRMPRHTHEGEELTLVLQGSFADATGTYARGDVATADARLDHQPQAGLGETCICLAVEEAPLRFTGVTGALLTAVQRLRSLLR
jgi:putative transcriptional regulator